MSNNTAVVFKRFCLIWHNLRIYFGDYKNHLSFRFHSSWTVYQISPKYWVMCTCLCKWNIGLSFFVPLLLHLYLWMKCVTKFWTKHTTYSWYFQFTCTWSNLCDILIVSNYKISDMYFRTVVFQVQLTHYM